MTDDHHLDLAQLNLEAARALVGQDFVRLDDSGPNIVLRLEAAEPAPRDPAASSGESGRPFSLMFRGPVQPELTQGMHDLENPDQSMRGIFLVPVGRNEESCSYEAVFS